MLQLIAKILNVMELLIVIMIVPCANCKPTNRLQKYFGAAGLMAIAVAVSPLLLAVKIFLLTSFTCIAAYVTLLAALPGQHVPVD